MPGRDRGRTLQAAPERARTEGADMAEISIHPAVDGGVKPGSKDFAGGVLRCLCASNPVEVSITGQCAHNHVCGCTKCWKPKGALFSQVAVVPVEKVQATRNADKLQVVGGLSGGHAVQSRSRYSRSAAHVRVGRRRRHQSAV